MSTQVGVAHVEQFKNNVIMLSQQRDSRLRGAVRVDPDFLKGKSGFYERIGATAVVKRTSRHSDTPLVSTPHSRRRVTMDDYEWADLIDRQDVIRMMIDPESRYAKNASQAMGRQMDDVIITAMGGSSYAIDEDDSASAVTFPAGQKVAHGSAGLTVAKILSAKEVLWANEVDDSEQMFIVCSGKQISDLLNTTEVKSSDFNTVKALAQGEISDFAGFTFIRSERLATDATPSRLAYAFVPSSIGLAIGDDVTSRVSERDDKSYATQVYLSMSIGATRVEEEKIVQIACNE
jgi:hypothetical protein